MNKDTLLGIVRHVLTTAGGVLVTKGTIDEGMATEIVGVVVGIVGVVWSFLKNRKGKVVA
jgi:hypothetical protein